MTMRRDAAFARPAALQDGLATRAQLRMEGLTDDQVDDALASGLLQRLHGRTFRHSAAPFTARTRLRAAILAGGTTAHASHRSAASLAGFEVRSHRPEIIVVGRGVPRLEGVRVHRTKLLCPEDRAVIAGIPATSPARTALDLGAVLPFDVVEHVVQIAIIEKRLKVPDLLAVLERAGASGRNGTGVLRAVVRQSLPEDGLESVLELKLLELIRRSGLPDPALQLELVCADGRGVRLDFAWPEVRLAVEADGRRWHGTRKQRERDRARIASLRATGWEHLAFGWNDVHTHAVATIDMLQALLPRFASR